MHIKTKILLSIIILTFIVAAAILIANISSLSAYVAGSNADRVKSAAQVAAHHLDGYAAQAASASLSLADNQAVGAAIIAGDRDELLAQSQLLMRKTGVDFCTITDAEGTVITRTHEPSVYGDSIADQANIQAAMRGERITAIVHGTVVALAVRSSIAVYDRQDRLIGIVSMGYRLDTEHFVDTIKGITGCEAIVFWGNTMISTTMLDEHGNRQLGTAAPPDIIWGGTPYTGEADVMGRKVIANYTPLTGPDDQVPGLLFVGRFVDETAQTVHSFLFNGLIILAPVMTGAIIIINIIVGHIVGPIRTVTTAAAALAAGDTDIDLRVRTRDEMRTLADVFNQMSAATRRQAAMIEHIADGSMSVAIEPRSDKDIMNRALINLYHTVQIQAAALNHEHERIRLLINSAPLSFNLWNNELHNIETNDTAVRLFGLADQAEYLARFYELSPELQPDGRPSRSEMEHLVRKTFAEGSLQFEWQHQKLDGTPIPTTVTLVRVIIGDEFFVAGYIRDLREQKRMIAAIEQRDDLLQIVNQVADILLRAEPDDFAVTLHQCMGMMAGAINADRMYIYKNYWQDGQLYYTQLYEWSEKARPYQDTAHTTHLNYDEKTPKIREILSRGEFLHSLVRDLSPAGQRWLGGQGILAVMLSPIFIREEFWGFVGFDNCHSEALFSENEESVMRSGSLLVANALLRHEDTLKIRDTSIRLEAALADAKNANNAKSSFLAKMSHEIRTPLNAVVGLSELILTDLTPENIAPAAALFPPAVVHHEVINRLEKIHDSGMTILSIVNDILDISKIESGNFELVPVRYDTPSLINDTATLNTARIGEKNIAFRIEVDENLPASLYGDDLRVKQIFNNLLSNAFKYTLTGTVTWRVSFEPADDGIWLVSSVTDTGLGIKPDDLPYLFSAYHQADRTVNRLVEGTGLGLSITSHLVEMMDGTITVASEYGQGTVFNLRVRQAVASAAAIGKEVAANLTDMRYNLTRRRHHADFSRVNLAYARVLVVDDIATNLDVVRGMLKPYRLTVDCASDGPQAIEAIRSGQPSYQAIFMDHMMPDMDGIEATRIIREEIGTDYARTVPIIALTANAIVGNEEMFLNHGFQAFISKPIDMIKLDAVLRQWVRDKDLEQIAERRDDINASAETDPGLNPDAGRAYFSSAPLSVLDSVVIDGLDLNRAAERFGGDETVLVEVLRSYADNTPPLLDRLAELLADEQLNDYAIIIHGIKGSSYGIEAQTAGVAAETLEAAARTGDLMTVRSGHPTFETITRTLSDNILRTLKMVGPARSKPTAHRPNPLVLRQLREACAAYDMDGVDRAMAQLESFNYEQDAPLVDWLRRQVDQMAFEAIVEHEWPDDGLNLSASGAAVLVVEDNETNRKAAVGLLKSLHIIADTAENGQIALEKIRQKTYHLILMDLLMPVLDGRETTFRLRQTEGEYYAQVPIVVLTADTAANEDLLHAGANELVTKPLDRAKLSRLIRRWLPAELWQEQELPPEPLPANLPPAPPPANLPPAPLPADLPPAPLPADLPPAPPAIPAVEGLDVQAGLRHTGGLEFYLDLLSNFYQLIDLKSAKMEQCFAAGHLRDLTIEAHALSSAARLLGADQLAAAFGRLEQYGNTQNQTLLAQELPAVLTQYRRFKTLLQPYCVQADTKIKETATGAELTGLLKSINTAIGSFDLDGADRAFRQLTELRLPDECRSQMAQLRALMADVAMEEIMTLTTQMIETISQLQ